VAKSLFPLRFPPGFFRNGTTYMTKGRWFNGSLVRWFEGALQPIGGWTPVLRLDDTAVTVDQPIRGMLGWKTDEGIAQLALGSYCKAWAYSVGVLTDITPGGIVCGSEDATVVDGGAYGEGAYGAGPYGGVVSDTRAQVIEANSWAFDTFGEELVAVSFADGVMWDWDLNVSNNLVAISNAPTANALVVTPERFLVALGADGDRRLVAWSDQDDRTVWSALSTNQAGDFPMPGAGDILAGRRGRNETLIWTETDLWVMRFIGGEFIYRFVQVGTNNGAISRMAMGALQSRHYWMGRRGFFVYDGFVKDLSSDVGDFVFNDFNTIQRSKVVCITAADHNEVTWYYPSSNSAENDKYVTFNAGMGIWYFGDLARTAGVDRGAHQNPIYAKVAAGVGHLVEHEKGTDYEGLVPFAETGPIEIGNGDQVMTVLGLIPDEKSLGDVTGILTFKNYPTDAGVEAAIDTFTGQTDIRATGRTVRLKVTQAQPEWRVGIMRLDVAPGGRR
jgi:hypothetical protein